jgi:hypothetical protein
MDDIVNIWMVIEDLVESSLVGDVELIEFRPLSADELDAVDDLSRRIIQIIDNDYFVIGFKKCQGCEGANVSGTTRTVSI